MLTRSYRQFLKRLQGKEQKLTDFCFSTFTTEMNCYFHNMNEAAQLQWINKKLMEEYNKHKKKQQRIQEAFTKRVKDYIDSKLQEPFKDERKERFLKNFKIDAKKLNNLYSEAKGEWQGNGDSIGYKANKMKWIEEKLDGKYDAFEQNALKEKKKMKQKKRKWSLGSKAQIGRVTSSWYKREVTVVALGNMDDKRVKVRDEKAGKTKLVSPKYLVRQNSLGGRRRLQYRPIHKLLEECRAAGYTG